MPAELTMRAVQTNFCWPIHKSTVVLVNFAVQRAGGASSVFCAAEPECYTEL